MATSFCDMFSNCTAAIAWRVAVIATFMTVGVIGNSTVLYIYRKGNSKQTGRIYMVAMAWMDIASSVLTLPQMPLFEMEAEPFSQLFLAQAFLMVVAYLFVQMAMVFDRVFAVFTPFKYSQNSNKSNKFLFVAFIPIETYLQVVFFLDTYSSVQLPYNIVSLSLSMVYILGFLVSASAYPAIALKLYCQRQKVAPNAQGANQATTNQQSEANKTRAVHIKTLKLYSGILVLFFITYVPNLVQAITHNRSLTYFYFFNSIGNPFIYYAFNDKFRNEVRDLVRKLKSQL